MRAGVWEDLHAQSEDFSLIKLGQLQRAVQVFSPTIPSFFGGCPSKSRKSPWKFLTAASVSGPKSLSAALGALKARTLPKVQIHA
jgi:hypothetical protein